MKIVAVAGSQIPSDTANSIQVMKACSALAQLGHEVTLIVPEVNVERSTLNVQRHYGIETSFPIEWLASPSRRLFTWQAVRRARALRADLLYTWFPQSAVFGLLHRIPTVFEIHLQPTGAFGPAWHRAFAALSGRKRLASITRALVDVLERRHNIRFHADEVVIAPNGVELERFASLPDPVTARQTLNLPPAPTVMCTGHLYAGRGADLFLALAKELPQAHFVWVGGRPADVELWKKRAQSDNVTFTGFIPNQTLPLYQAAADILLMPYSRSIMGSSGTADSASVASPMKMFEYMAAGRAIVTADLPVIREVLNEKNAVFCEPDNLEDWKMGIGKLLADEPRRRSLGEQARQDVQGYTWLARAERVLVGFIR
ncbi:MAG: glycosyltransferase [Chloroflexota bacterium]|jgi:glycosyltransferase involved in cell wall biosynthesis